MEEGFYPNVCNEIKPSDLRAYPGFVGLLANYGGYPASFGRDLEGRCRYGVRSGFVFVLSGVCFVGLAIPLRSRRQIFCMYNSKLCTSDIGCMYE